MIYIIMTIMTKTNSKKNTTKVFKENNVAVPEQMFKPHTVFLDNSR